jgi:hypothetical protein
MPRKNMTALGIVTLATTKASFGLFYIVETGMCKLDCKI